MTQLELAVDGPRARPDPAFFDAEGPRRLLWCSDAVRIAFHKGADVPCPFLGDRERFRPVGGCCKDIAHADQD